MKLLLLNAEAPLGDSSWMIMMAMIFAVMYFFMIRPQQQKAKKTKTLLDDLKKDSNLVTIGGVHGKVVKVEETTFTIEVESGARMKVEKQAVSLDYTQAAYGSKEK